jgi:hypothetical protein
VSGGREARLALALVVLALVAVSLVISSPEGAESGEDRPRAAASSPTPSSQSSPSPSPTDTPVLDGAARRLATRWAEAYTTSQRNEPWAARLARLRPYSSRALIAEMRVNSGALELERDRRSIGEVVATQAQDSTERKALMVLVEQTTVTRGRRATELISVTLELVSGRDGWKVAEVLVP